MAESRWRQDLEVAQLIQHLKQDEKRNSDGLFDWSRLSKSEEETVLKELDRCRKDFVYAARNYFWITTKARQDILLTLWPGQELILQKILELKRKGKSQRICIIKGRQLGASTVIEALIAWRTMFFANVNALVVSYDHNHTANVLYPIMTTIVDKMPWWLKPMVGSRKNDDGISFENPRPDLREENPGLKSRVYVKAASTTTAVGMGIRLNAVHVSEFASFDERTAREIIDQDMRHALADGPDTFAILESTAKGANKYAHRLWKKCVERGDRAEWYPLFLPAFFESNRTTVPPPNWKIKTPEYNMRQKVEAEWVRCDNKSCLQYHMRYSKGEDVSGSTCVTCEQGKVWSYKLTDGQCCYMEDGRLNAEHDEKSQKKLKQELCCSATESFQLEGYEVFGPKAQDFADVCTRPPIAVGDYDAMGLFHGVNNERIRWLDGPTGKYKGCYQEDCTVDHEWTDNPLRIWEWPKAGGIYCMGADVAEGLGGKNAYSVAVMIKYSYQCEPNEQVATWRSNEIDPLSFAGKLNSFGRHYNDAMAAVEVNRFDSTNTTLRMDLNYPHIYRWKHMDSINPLSNKLGWFTNLQSRPRLWMTLRLWLQQGLMIVRSANLCDEMRNFVKEDREDVAPAGDQDTHDDELIACHPKGVLIRTSDGVKPIEEVRVGDMVLTHMGRFMPVLSTNCRSEYDKVYRVRISSKQDLLITGNHRIQLWEKWKQYYDNGKNVCWRNYRNPKWISINEASRPLTDYGTSYPIRKEIIDRESVDLADYLPADKTLVERNGFVSFAKGGAQHSGRMKNVKRHLPVDKDFCRLLGYYLAEGGKGNHNLIFASHEREEPIRAWLNGYLKSLGLSPGLRAHSPHGRLVWVTSTVFHAFFSQFGVKNFKRLPYWTETLPAEKQREILIGYLLVEGSFRLKGGAINAVTVSPIAAHQLLDMSLRCGWPLRFTRRKGQSGNLEQWVLDWSSLTANDIKKHIEPELLECKRPFSKSGDRSVDKVRLQHDYIVSQIKEVVEVEHVGPVYNLHVAEDNSYVANGTVVHNCMISLYCANENLLHDGLGLAMPRNQVTDDNANFFVTCKACGTVGKEMVIDRERLNPMLSAPTLDATGRIQTVGGMKCRTCGGVQLEITQNPQKQAAKKTEADFLLDDLDPARLPPELDPNTWELPTYDSL